MVDGDAHSMVGAASGVVPSHWNVEALVAAIVVVACSACSGESAGCWQSGRSRSWRWLGLEHFSLRRGS